MSQVMITGGRSVSGPSRPQIREAFKVSSHTASATTTTLAVVVLFFAFASGLEARSGEGRLFPALRVGEHVRSSRHLVGVLLRRSGAMASSDGEEEEGCGLSDFLNAIEDSDEEEGAKPVQRVRLANSVAPASNFAPPQTAAPRQTVSAAEQGEGGASGGAHRPAAGSDGGGGGYGRPSRAPAPFFHHRPGTMRGGSGEGEGVGVVEEEEDQGGEEWQGPGEEVELSLRAIRAIDKEEMDPTALTSILGDGEEGIAEIVPLDGGLDGYLPPHARQTLFHNTSLRPTAQEPPSSRDTMTRC